MATRQRTPNAMDLLLGAVPKPAPAASAAAPATASLAEPADGQTPAILLEETGELLSEEIATPEPPAEPVAEVVAVETPVDEAVATVATAEPVATPPAPRTRRRRSPAAASTGSAEPASPSGSTDVPVEPAVPVPEAVTVVETGAEPPEKPTGRRRRDPDEDLEPAYVPIKVTVSIPAVVLSELIRTVQTIRRMTGRRQPVNQGTVIAAALEMAFEEFRTKGATSQLVDKLRIE